MNMKDYYDMEYYKNIDSSKPLHEINTQSLAFRKKILSHLFKGRKICDVGCGPGFYVEFCVNNGMDCAGVDISSKVIQHCKNNIKNALFYAIDAENERLPKKFEGVFSFDVIEHSFNYDNLLKHIYDALTEGGIALISTPNILAPKNRIKFLLGMGTPFFDKEHLHFFTPKLLFQSMKYAGFKNVRLIGTGKLAWLSTSLAGNIYAIGEKRG